MVSHGSLDIEHMQHFEKLMNCLEDEADKAVVLHSAGVFYELYTNIFAALPLTENFAREKIHAA
ncbi:MAG: biliverdin-producing heme oxygenase, partial [Gammaproteobacteria bacterium]|nr:biliverdin-producing heme oxygenase [Gammaproteobacteria bacterium]